ncbi:FtsX-like permease family protein [Streptomyces sp. H27-C3]|uniref:FtsX-like permease family protein n=1 Tax=Streptomyces sp. H27-C3 TaxID=3046305 RepID=UPI0024BABCDF|nr:FtsX-like permease family protein [Streptomyces sp. H27-C3]MDJ0466655.1 ABC transporter permease [Streptomyces sp. H27-C3]
MKEFLLGLRLLFGSGRGNRVRFFLMAAGGSIGVCCLALVLTIPAILDAHDGRAAAREPRTASAGRADATLLLQRSDPYGSKAFTRVFIAKGTAGRQATPPGLSELPGPGEVVVSPRVRALLRDQPAARGLLPGREKGVIGPSGLAHPDELYAYIGTTHKEIADEARVLTGFGYGYAPFPAVEPSTLTNLRFALGTLVLLPLGIFLSVCARLSAASRTRRLAALRLLGLSVKGTQRVNATETVVAALLGALLGLGEYWALNQVMSRTGLPGLKWYPGDGALSTTTIVICLLGCPALAWFVGRASARDAAANPLAVRRTAVPKPPSKWGGLLLVTGLGIVIGYCATGLTTHPASNTGINALLVPAGVLLTGIGLVLTLPLISFTLARKVARSTQSLTLNLAMRRNEIEPGSTMRVVTGLVLLVYAASLAQGILIELKQVTRPHAPAQDYAISLSGLTPRQQHALSEVPGVRAHALTMDSWTDPNESDAEVQPRATALVATCAQLAALVEHSRGCVDGKVLRLTDPNSSTDPGVAPGASFVYRVREGGKNTALNVTLPSTEIVYKAYAPSAVGSASVLVPPAALPAEARPQSAQFVLTSSSDPDAVRQVLDGIGAIAPTAEIDPVGININGLRQIIVIQTLLVLGMIMGLVIGVAAFLVSVTDRAVERRAQVTAITLIGARARTMRAVQCAQVVLPLSIGLALALLAGKLAESSYLITGGGEVLWDISGLPLLVIAAGAVVAAAAAGSLPLVGRRINPELIRRD